MADPGASRAERDGVADPGFLAIEQYKVAVESANRYDDRRTATHRGFFLFLSGIVIVVGAALHAGFFGPVDARSQTNADASVLSFDGYWKLALVAMLVITGPLFALSWGLYVRSANRQSRAMWKVVHEMETCLEIVVVSKRNLPTIDPKPPVVDWREQPRRSEDKARDSKEEPPCNPPYQYLFPYRPFYRANKEVVTQEAFKTLDPGSLWGFLAVALTIEFVLFFSYYMYLQVRNPAEASLIWFSVGVFAVIAVLFLWQFIYYREEIWHARANWRNPILLMRILLRRTEYDRSR